jgi:hypothetical protein
MSQRWFIMALWLAVLLLTGGTEGTAAMHTWKVVAPANLDSRLKDQVTSLAQQQGAEIQFVPIDNGMPEALPAPDVLVIQLTETINPSAWTPEMDREGYQLQATFPPGQGPAKVQIRSKTSAGFHHALLRLPGLLHQTLADTSDIVAKLNPAPQDASVENFTGGAQLSIEDFPSFPERGIVEGFYGKPWSHQDRLTMLRFEGAHGMNVYYYAPKDDPYHRHLWRKPYPKREAERLGALVSASRENFVNFCFAISPGLSIRYSSPEDFRELTSKLASVGKLGVSCFALFLDDVPPELQDVADRVEFKTLAQAHASLINRLYDGLQSRSPNNRLVVTPTTYANAWGKRDYIEELGALVRPEIPMVWTGIDTFSPVITREQALDWGKILRRRPLVWDNFPVNDAESWRPYLGPLVGRGPDLNQATQGFFANPMIQPRASMIPLATVADYLWNPAAYNPAKSLDLAVRAQYGDEGTRILELFLKTYADYHWDDNLFTPLFYSRRYALDITAMQDRLGQLESALQEMSSKPEYQQIAQELAPFIPRTRRRLEEVLASPAFERLPDGRLAPRADFDTLEASYLPDLPMLDGDFAKWDAGRLITLDQKEQLMRGANFWKGPENFSARAALHWDREYLYVGADVTDRDRYQPATGRGIEDGDVVILTIQTAFRKNFSGTTATGDEYRFYFSPGNFAGVPPSLFSNEDYLPPRNRPHDHAQEIRSVWRKTAQGYSGDIAIPASYFDGGRLEAGYEIGLGVAVQNVVRQKPKRSARSLEKVILISKKNSLFPVYLSNPSSYPRLVLVQ